MRVLLHEDADWAGRTVGEADLPVLYATPDRPWLRANMVTTLDGAATGPDGRSGSINNDVDHAVFRTVRALADAVVVGAGTARAEGYRPVDTPIVVVSRSGEVPAALRGADAGQVLLATTASSPGREEATRLLGADHVLVVGGSEVDPVGLVEQLRERGLRQLLTEGGPGLLADLLAAGVVDEVCLTTVPRVLGGGHRRMTQGAADLDVPLRPTLLLEHDGTLLGRWAVDR